MNQQVVYQDISQIHPYKNNPRNNEAAIEPVAQSIKRFGFRVPILIDGKGTIIAGHTRYEAAKRLDMDKVPCIRVDDLTDAQIRAYRIADNKVAEASSWNDDILRTEMHRNLKEAGRIAEHGQVLEKAVLGCTKGCTQEAHPVAPKGCIFKMHPARPGGSA